MIHHNIRQYSLLIIAFFLLDRSYGQQKNITLNNIWGSPMFVAKRPSGFASMADGEHYTELKTAGKSALIIKYSLLTGKAVDTIFNAAAMKGELLQAEISSYSFSADEKSLLIAANAEAIYRHSSKADYFLYSITTGKSTKLNLSDKIMYCTLSPDGSKAAWVFDNNLYLMDLQTFQPYPITSDGKKNEIINGATDWVYEEEFSMDRAYEWSPDSRSIAFYRFDESRVKEFDITYYGDLYPKEERYKYPKAGEENSKVDIYIFNTASRKTIKAETGEHEYIPRIKWTNNSSLLSIQRCNRHQNVLELLFCNSLTGQCNVILKEENQTFIDITDDLTFPENGKQFIWTSKRSGYNHIYLYNIDGTLSKQITQGDYNITAFFGYDNKSQLFYFQSTENSPTERNIYSVDSKGNKKSLTPERGVHQAYFSARYKYFLDNYSSYGNPYLSKIRDTNGKDIRTLEDNKSLKDFLAAFNLGKIDTLSVKNSSGTVLNGWIIKPPDFNPTKKYPVLMHVYGGPGKQTVLNQWLGADYMWHQMLAQKGYIIISVDNRGTPGRSLEFSNCIYRVMGQHETEDQLDVAAWIKNLSYVDSSRVGVWGWSFGGYLTSLLMTKGKGTFKAGIAVAPVTNWRYYDNIYTERYLQTPAENASGYDDNSPLNYAKDLTGKLLLVHGSSDDNVHVQNSMDFINALIKANKQFDLMIYPNRNHGISGGGARLHLYTKMTDFILTNL